MKGDGLVSLYRGLSSPLIGSAIETAVIFAIYGQLKNWLRGEEKTLTLQQSLFAGGTAGAFVGLTLTPIELIKCRMQASRAYTSTLDCTMQTIRMDGVRGLFRGGSSTMLREIPGTAVWFSTYDIASRRIHQLYTHFANVREGTTPPGPINQCLSGAIAGCLYWLIPYPIDTIKTKVQTTGGVVSEAEIVRLILQAEGVRGLYKGVGLTMLRAIPTSAAIFLTYEQIFGLVKRIWA